MNEYNVLICILAHYVISTLFINNILLFVQKDLRARRL